MNNDKGKLYYGIGLDNEQLRTDASESKNIIREIGNSTLKEGDRIDSAYKKIGASIATVFTMQQATSFARKIIQVRGEIESLEISFETLAGKTKGKELFGDIRQWVINTPMMMQDAAKGAQMLLSFNVEAERVMPILKQIGDISKGDSEKFNSLTLAFSQMSSTGKLMGQDLLQMINAGFNPLTGMAEKTGKSIGQLKKDMEDGLISSEMVADAFAAATAEGGKFYGMLEKQSKGVDGSISNLEGSIEDLFNDLGTKNQDFITGSIQIATDLVKHYKEVGESLAVLVSIYGAYKAAVIATDVVEKIRYQSTLAQMAGMTKMQAITDILRSKTEALNKTIISNQYALAAAAVLALSYGIYKLATYQTDAEQAQSRLNQSIKESEKSSLSETRELSRLKGELSEATKGSKEYNDIKKTIIDNYGKYYNGLSEEIDKVGLLDETYQKLTKSIIESSNARSYDAFRKDESNKLDEVISNNLGKIQDRLISELGEEAGAKYYAKIRNAIITKSKISDDVTAIIDKVQDKGSINADSRIDNYIRNIRNAISLTEELDKKARSKFGIGETYKSNESEGSKISFDAENASLQKLMEMLPKAKEKLEELKRADQPDDATIAAKEKEIQQINSQIVAHEKSLTVIKDVKAQIELLTKEQEQYGKNDAEYKSLDNRIKSLKTKLPLTEGQNNKTENEDARIKRETAERTQKIQEYAEAVAKQVKQSELDITQARIDAMDDGFDKELAQIEQAYNRLIFANQQREAEMLEALRDARELEWENKNPKAKAKGETFDRSTVTVADLAPEQKASITEYYRVAEEIREKANKDSLEKILSDVMTYEQERTKIVEDYEKKREQLYDHDKDGKRTGLKKGIEQGNVDELDRNEQEALKAVDEEFATREETYQSWMNAIGNMTLKQLQVILAQAEKELAELEKSGTGDSKKLSVARAKVNTAKQKVAKASADNDVSPNKRTIKEWEDLYKALTDCEKEFESIGDTVGGVAGQIIKSAGGISTSTLSMINGIMTLTNSASTGMGKAGESANKAISTVEKASIILTIITSAFQIATKIISLFNNDENYQKEIEKLQSRIDQLQWELDNADSLRLQKNTIAAIAQLRETYKETTQEVVKLYSISNQYANSMYKFFGVAIYKNDILIKSSEKLAKAYANISYTADKALGEDKFTDAKSQLENIAQQQLLIQEQINKEDAKKNTDHGKIEDWERQIQELGEEANKIINEIVEGIIGGTSDEIANDLADAFFDAFQAGEDYAEAWGDKVNDIVADVIKRMLVSKYLEEPLGAIFDKYKSQWYKDGEFAGIDAVIASMSGFASDLNSVGDEFKIIWENLPDSVKNMFTVTDDATREASQKGIATASQESVDENNGRLTAIQGHTYSILDYSKQLVDNSNRILNLVMGIKEDTKQLERLETIEDDMKSVKDTVNDIVLKGIKLK